MVEFDQKRPESFQILPKIKVRIAENIYNTIKVTSIGPNQNKIKET